MSNVLQAILSLAGEDVGVVRLSSDGELTVDTHDPDRKEQIERLFRETAPIEYATGYEGKWDEFTHSGDRVWFEKALRSLEREGYEYKLIKADEEQP